MAQVEPIVLTAIKVALARYTQEVNNSDLADTAKWTYIENATRFVRWLDDDFEPGSGKG